MNIGSGHEPQGVELCDEMKLLKLLEHERKKKAKLSHAGLLVGPGAAADYHYHYGQRNQGGPSSGSLKRKRKGDMLFSNDLK